MSRDECPAARAHDADACAAGRAVRPRPHRRLDLRPRSHAHSRGAGYDARRVRETATAGITTAVLCVLRAVVTAFLNPVTSIAWASNDAVLAVTTGSNKVGAALPSVVCGAAHEHSPSCAGVHVEGSRRVRCHRVRW